MIGVKIFTASRLPAYIWSERGHGDAHTHRGAHRHGDAEPHGHGHGLLRQGGESKTLPSETPPAVSKQADSGSEQEHRIGHPHTARLNHCQEKALG